MKEFWNFIQMVFMAVGGWLGWFMGGCDGLLYALIAFVVIDYLTGVMCAFADHTLSSEVGFRGICRGSGIRRSIWKLSVRMGMPLLFPMWKTV